MRRIKRAARVFDAERAVFVLSVGAALAFLMAADHKINADRAGHRAESEADDRTAMRR